ncbi:hypothetical protein ACVWZZ_007470 [Bradyrhizobium sp. LM6.10]
MKVNSAGSTPQGSVFISATGDINSASPYDVANPVVIGKNVEINSTAGAIGATSSVVNGASTLTNINPLVIQATGTTQAGGSIDGGVLDSASATGAYIVQSKGDLRLGTVQSSGGPVFLEAAGSDGNQASILNGRTAVGLTQAQSQHLQDVWASLDLLSGNAATNAVNSYQSMVTSAYNDYFQLKNIAFTNGSTYNPTSVGLTVLRAQVAAKLGIDPANVSTTDMKVEATTRFLRDQFLLGRITTDELKTSLTTLLGTAPADPLATVFGSSLSSTLFTKLFDGVTTANQRLPSNTALQTALTTYSANYTYTLASTERVYGIITAGAQWTPEPARLHRLVVGRRRRTAADRRERRGQCQRQPDHALRAARFGRQFGRAAGVHFHERRFLVADAGAEGIARDRRPRSAHCRRGHRPDDPCRDIYGQPVAAEPRRCRQPDRDLGQGADECLSRQQEQPYTRRHHCELRPGRGRAGQRHRSDRPRRRQARRRDQHHRRRRS